MEPTTNVVLVHGAWADGSCWSKVIPLLQDKGLNVTAVQLALDSLENDIEVTRRALTALTGTTVLVGHSYGGAVITGAAKGIPGVAALVYITAFAVDEGESLDDLSKQGPQPPGAAHIRLTSTAFSGSRRMPM
jgi:pimeloyl-ACP methyl ester carboxylesterase